MKSRKFWCTWMSRYLFYVGRSGSKYVFEDFGDCRFYLTEAEVEKLEKR